MPLPNLGTLALSPGNVLVRCPECASLFRKASPTGCAECGGKRKREKEEKECECKKECACDDVDVPDPNDPNTSAQWKNAFLEARGISYGSLSMGPDEPEPWQVEAAKRKIAKQDKAQGTAPSYVGPDPDNADQPEFQSGCREEDCEPMFSSGCREEDCEPVYQSCGCDEEEKEENKEEKKEEESEDESEGEGDSEGDWEDDANFDYYRAVGRPPYTP